MSPRTVSALPTRARPGPAPTDLALVVDDGGRVVGHDPALGATSAWGWVHPDDVADVVAAHAGIVAGRRLRTGVRARVAAPGGWEAQALTLRGLVGPDGPLVLVTTVGRAASGADGPGPEELRRRLERIGAEVRASGVVGQDRPLVERARQLRELGGLTNRQWEVLAMVLDGHRVPQVALDLGLGQSTVRSHLAVVFRRLGVHSQDDLVERLRAS